MTADRTRQKSTHSRSRILPTIVVPAVPNADEYTTKFRQLRRLSKQTVEMYAPWVKEATGELAQHTEMLAKWKKTMRVVALSVALVLAAVGLWMTYGLAQDFNISGRSPSAWGLLGTFLAVYIATIAAASRALALRTAALWFPVAASSFVAVAIYGIIGYSEPFSAVEASLVLLLAVAVISVPLSLLFFLIFTALDAVGDELFAMRTLRLPRAVIASALIDIIHAFENSRGGQLQREVQNKLYSEIDRAATAMRTSVPRLYKSPDVQVDRMQMADMRASADILKKYKEVIHRNSRSSQDRNIENLTTGLVAVLRENWGEFPAALGEAPPQPRSLWIAAGAQAVMGAALIIAIPHLPIFLEQASGTLGLLGILLIVSGSLTAVGEHRLGSAIFTSMLRFAKPIPGSTNPPADPQDPGIGK